MSDLFGVKTTSLLYFQIAGIFFMLVSIVQFFRMRSAVTGGIKTEATVKEIVQIGNDVFKFFPVMEYRLLTGETIVKRSYIGGRKNMYKAGEKIQIIYHQSSPESFLINKGMDKYWKILGSFILGIAFIIAGFIK